MNAIYKCRSSGRLFNTREAVARIVDPPYFVGDNLELLSENMENLIKLLGDVLSLLPSAVVTPIMKSYGYELDDMIPNNGGDR